MAIEGSIRDLNLIDLFQVLALAQKTGFLEVTGPAEEAKVFFLRGMVAFAEDRKAVEQGKEFLVRLELSGVSGNGSMVEQIREIWSALEGKGETQTLSSLRRSLIAVTEEAVYRLFNWEEGRFRFEESPELTGFDSRMSLALKTENLIMEGSRRIDEWSRIMTKIPSLDAVFILTPDEGERREIDLRPEEWAILAQVDGRKRVREIIGNLGGKDFEVARTLYGLAATGLVRTASSEAKVGAAGGLEKGAEERLESGKRWLVQGDLDRAWRRPRKPYVCLLSTVQPISSWVAYPIGEVSGRGP